MQCSLTNHLLYLGIHRAERVMWYFFEIKNQQKQITRMNEEDHGTYFTEKLLHLNSYALAVGYSREEAPFNDISSPTTCSFSEYLGFNYKLPTDIGDVSNPTDMNTVGRQYDQVDDDENEEDGGDDSGNIGDDELVQLLQDVYGQDGIDVEVVLEDHEYGEPNGENIQRELQQLELDDVAEAARITDEANRKAIEAEMSRLLPEEGRYETSLDVFKRLTSKRPWIPFRARDSTTEATDIDREEAMLFDQWRPRYSRNSRAPGNKQFRRFVIDWNNEVSRRFKVWSTGGSIVQIRLKSEIQLQEYDDRNNELQSLQAVAPMEDDHRTTLDATLQTTRRLLPPTGPAHTVTPPQYVNNTNGTTPFGVPLVLNSAIAMGALRNNTVNTNNMRQPYVLALPNLPQQAPPRPPPKKQFRTRKYCIVCGWRKQEHSKQEGRGGKDKKGNSNCKRNYCGNCYQLEDVHVARGTLMGPACTLPTNRYCSANVNDWFDYRVSNSVVVK